MEPKSTQSIAISGVSVALLLGCFASGASGKGSAQTIVVQPNGDVVAAWATLVSQGRGNWASANRSARLPAGARSWASGPELPWRSAQAASLASDRPGSLTAVWYRRAGGLATATRAAGQTKWSSPQLLKGTGSPMLAVARNGAALLVWQQYKTKQIVTGRVRRTVYAAVAVQTAFRQSDATKFGPVTELATGPRPIRDVQLGIDSSGTATVAWLRDVGGRWQAEVATRPGGAKTWRPVEALTDANTKPRTLALAAGPDGRALVVSGTNERLLIAERPAADGRFVEGADIPWRPIATAKVRSSLAAMIRTDGTAVVAWNQPTSQIDALTRTPNGRWGAPEVIDRGGLGPVELHELGARTLVTWRKSGSARPTLSARQLAADLTWSRRQELGLAGGRDPTSARFARPLQSPGVSGGIIWWTLEGPSGSTLRAVRWTPNGPIRLPDLPIPTLSRENGYEVGFVRRRTSRHETRTPVRRITRS